MNHPGMVLDDILQRYPGSPEINVCHGTGCKANRSPLV
jgi:hypothetical protein